MKDSGNELLLAKNGSLKSSCMWFSVETYTLSEIWRPLTWVKLHSEMLLILSLKVLFSFLKIKRITHFHCHQIQFHSKAVLLKDISVLHGSPSRILILQCLSCQRNKEHLIELINGSILHSIWWRQSKRTCYWKLKHCLLQTFNLSAKVIDKPPVWPCLGSKLSDWAKGWFIDPWQLISSLCYLHPSIHTHTHTHHTHSQTHTHTHSYTHTTLSERHVLFDNMPFTCIYSSILIWLVSHYF